MREIVIYQEPSGQEPFWDWLMSLKDKTVKYRVEARVERLKNSNYGDHKRFQGIIELRLDFGKGYRVYCGEDGHKIIVLLMGGDKSSQDKDIKKAIYYWRQYHE